MAAGEGKPIGRATVEVSLEYPGKTPRSDVLNTAPAKTALVAGAPGEINRLYFGDNLGVLAGLAVDPQVARQIRLVYIDPPFATQSNFQSRKLQHAYDDMLAGPAFIEFLRQRLILIHQLLADDGSLYVHLDERMAFHFRIILDEIFGPQNYRNCITRKKCNPKNYTRNSFGNVADYILFYSKSDKYVWDRAMQPWDDERAKSEYQYTDRETGRRYKKVPVHAPGVRNGETGKEWKGKLPPPGKHWQYPPRVLEEMDARGEIYWSPTGNPRRKIYFDKSEGIPLQDIWTDVRDAHNQNVRITGYPTEKNPEILKRIILASSNPGDLVLDCFAGSGTTLAVASELDRRWIGIDKSPVAIRTILKRFAHGLEVMGDFVSTVADERPQMGLFVATKNEGESDASRSAGHIPITNFSLFATEDLRAEAEKMIPEDSSAPGSIEHSQPAFHEYQD